MKNFPKKLLAGLSITIFVVSFITPNAHALSCMRQGPLGRIWEARSVEFVFEGYVESVGEPKIVEPYLIENESGDFQFTRIPEIEGNYPDSKPYQVEVSKVWKGSVDTNKVVVYAGGDLYQHDIEVGKHYFFLINSKGEDGFYLGSCSPSTYSPLWGRMIFFSHVIIWTLFGLAAVGIAFLIRRKMKHKNIG